MWERQAGFRGFYVLPAAVALISGSTWLAPGGAVRAQAADRSAATLCAELTQAYLAGRAQQVKADLRAALRQQRSLSAEQRQTVLYIRRAWALCRPAWWDECKQNRKTFVHTELWGRSLNVMFDPQVKSGIELRSGGVRTQVFLHWNTADMDSTAPAEHGFTRGDLGEMDVWLTLGTAEGMLTVPPDTGSATKAADLKLARYLDLRAQLAAAYSASPPARRWALFLDTQTFTAHYDNVPTVMGHRAVGALVVAEIVSHPERYPSFALPAAVPSGQVESKLAAQVSAELAKHGWTLAEDRALRAAVKACAVRNVGLTVYATGKVTLPNGQVLMLDPAADASARRQRDAWLTAHYPRATR